MSVHLKICRDICGKWSVHGLSPLPVSNLPSLSASIDYAREQCAAAPATIELLVDGLYVVIHQELGWPRRVLAAKPDRAPPAVSSQRNGVLPRLHRFLARVIEPRHSRRLSES
jgi:hypothetical protein